MSDAVSYERRGDVGVITVNNPPVNALGHAVRTGLADCLNKGDADDGARALIVIGSGRTFPAGADITEFGKPMKSPGLGEVIAGYEKSTKPVIAAIHGTALGGGLEVALGCDYRVMAPKAQVGLPEVKLGILPGAGGTQRLPRLIGAEAALGPITTGDFISAKKAEELGIADAVIEGDLLDGAIAFAEKVIKDKKGKRPLRDMEAKASPELFAGAREDAAKRYRGMTAPQRCIDAVENATTLPFDEGLKKEREYFTELVSSDQSAALRYMFFAERQVTKIDDVPKDTPRREIKTAAVIGAGTMGGGIAMNFANAGIPVTVIEVAQEALDKGLKIIEANYAATVKKGRLTQDKMAERMGLISGALDYDALKDADVIVEAAFENMALKKEIFAKLDAAAKKGAILATNTSTLDVDEIARATKRPADVLGMHFFSPANVMRLLEIVRGKETAKDALATVMDLSKTIGKVGVVVGVCDGFVGNRMLHAYYRQASFLIEEGALPQQIDKVMYDWGWAMGPFAVMDLAGNDVGWRIRKERGQTAEGNLPYPSTIADRLCEQDPPRFGQKTGAGWYRYEKGNRSPIPDPEVEKLIIEVSREKGIERREISDEEIIKRCIYALVNEGANILEEGIAQRASDIDVIYNYGYGFPRFRGGPMFYADQVGLENVLADIKKFDKEIGAYWEPAPLLEKLVKDGKSFRDL